MSVVKKRTIKPKSVVPAVVANPSFRLIDFHFQDEKKEESTSSSSSDEDSLDGGRGKKGGNRQRKEFIIQMFGVNEKKETCCLFVRHYHPFFYVQVGQDWNEMVAENFLTFLKGKINPSMERDILKVSLMERGPLYGFAAGKQAKFVEISFANMAAFNAVKGLWYEKDRGGNRRRRALVFYNTALELFESNLPPLLRFFHIYNVSPSGWVEIPLSLARTTEVKKTTCTYEWSIGCGDLISLSEKNTAVPYKICSFDIEATSSHGDFPLPVKTYRKLADQIIACFSIQQQTASMNVARGQVLFRKIMLSAFGLENYNGIDLVYPKPFGGGRKLTKKQIGEWSDALLDMELFSKSGVMEKGNGKKGGEAWTLEQSFLQKQIMEDEEEEGYEGGHGYMDRKEEEEREGTKIMEILLDNSGKYTREAKVNIVNCLLSKSEVLPELKGDEVSFIGSTFLHYGETEPYLNHCLVVGSCDSVPGVEIVSCSTERELLLAWTELMQRENPDILIGYNIFMFDYEFMFQRAKENGCAYEFLQLSRLLGEVCSSRNLPPREGDGGVEVEKGLEGILVGGGEEDSQEGGGGWGVVDPKLKHTKLVIASGEYDLRYVEIKGRLQVDMFMYFRRDFQLSSYKLDDVAGLYIGDEISCVEEGEYGEEGAVGDICMFLTTKNVKGLHVDDYIHVHKSEFTTDYLEGGRKFKVIGIEDADDGKGRKLLVIQGVVDNLGVWKDYAKEGVLGWGIAKDDVSPQDIFRLTNGSAADRAVVAKYCIQDCNLVHTLFLKMDVLTTYVEMARICNVPMSYLVFRGQGIKLTSYVAQKCRKMGALMPDLERGTGDGQDGYEGAIVLPPKCAMYFDNPVACNDFASLYPSIAEAYNLCPQSLVWTKTYDLEGKLLSFKGEAPRIKGGEGRSSSGKDCYDNEPGYKYVDVEFDTFSYIRKTAKAKAVKTKTGTKICRWAQFPDGRKSIVPAIIHELLTARNDTKAQMKKESDDFMKNVLDKRQLGLKVTANSLYGQFGSKTSPFFQKDVAASITAIGRKMITYVKRMVEELYGKLLIDVPAVYCEKGSPKDCVKVNVRTKAEYVYGDTDSVFFTFNLEDPLTGSKIRGKRALEISITLAQEVARLCSLFLPPPMKLAYEKTLMNFNLLSKKRYVGMLYETDPTHGHLKYMGLALKRRDVCDYLKDVYGNLIMIFKEGSTDTIQVAIEYLNQALESLVEGGVAMDKLVFSKALRSYYKTPEQIAHAVLAERMALRDPGNRPKPGDRIKFAVVEMSTKEQKRIIDQRNKNLPPEKAKKTLMMGERIETPEYIVGKGLKLDYAYYIEKQLLNPIRQLFGLILEPILEYKGRSSEIPGVRRELEDIRKNSVDLEDYMDKREKYCSKKVEHLLFNDVFITINNRKNGLKPITEFYTMKSKN
jgi:DNA polymerase elongation subunit (family B)